MTVGDLVKFGLNWKECSLSVVTTFGFEPRASHFSQNWCSVAPYRWIYSNSWDICDDLQSSSDLHRKHLSHILFLCNCDNNWNLRLSFVATWGQNEHLQHKNLQVNLQSRSCWSSPCFRPSPLMGSNTPCQAHKQSPSAR